MFRVIDKNAPPLELPAPAAGGPLLPPDELASYCQLAEALLRSPKGDEALLGQVQTLLRVHTQNHLCHLGTPGLPKAAPTGGINNTGHTGSNTGSWSRQSAELQARREDSGDDYTPPEGDRDENQDEEDGGVPG